MKQILYFTIFFASIGTLGLVATNPKAVQQAAQFLGMTPPVSQNSSPTDRANDDHLAKFLSHYSGENTLADPPKPEPTIILPPPIPKIESPKIEPPKPEPPKAEPPKSMVPKTEVAVTPIIPVDPFQNNKQTPPSVTAPTAPPVAEPFPAIPPAQKPEPVDTILTQPKSIPENSQEDAGFASSKHGAVSPSTIEDLEKWSEPTPIPGFAQQPVQPIPPRQPIEPVQSAMNLPVPQNPVPQAPETNTFDSMALQKQPNDLFLQAANSSQPILPPPVNSIYTQNPPSQLPSEANVPVPLNSPLLPVQNTETLQQTSLSVPQSALPKTASQIQISPSVVAEEVPCYGTMMVARVGTQVILMCDILPQLRRAGIQVLNENTKKMSDEERSQIPLGEKEKFVDMFVENQYPAFLQEQITVALVFNDYLLAKSKEEREMFDKKFGEEFDLHEVPAMMKEFSAKNNVELKQYLKEKMGSSLDRERMLWVRSKIAQQWIMFNMQEASGECTHDEMMEFYTEHKDMFTSETRAQWLELFAAFSNHPTEEAAKNKIAWMGNQVIAGYPFEEIAKVNSEGFTASKGGLWDWTKKGSLSSPELEQAIFSLPVDKMSPIIKGEKGFHIIRVVKREETETTPFIVAQVTIREKIKMQRRQKMQTEYFDELKKRYAVYIFKDHIDFNISRRESDTIDIFR